jgi:hypothetical protein
MCSGSKAKVGEAGLGIMELPTCAVGSPRTIPHTTTRCRQIRDSWGWERYDELMDASDAVVDLVRSAKLDAAEVAARDLLARFPDQPDGWDRLGHGLWGSR